MREKPPLRFYRVLSRGWRGSYIVAESSSRAIEVAVRLGVHKRGKRVRVWELSLTGAPSEIVKFCHDREPGRVVRRWRKFTLLVKELGM